MSEKNTVEPTHAQMLAQILEEIEQAKRTAAANDELLSRRIDLINRALEAGGGRFSRIEALLERTAEERAQLNTRLEDALDRLFAIEKARAIVNGVDREIAARSLRWRKRIGAILIFLFGQGGTIAVLTWWFTRHPPGGSAG
jgi:ABC-type transporter Mla subunit MlaD